MLPEEFPADRLSRPEHSVILERDVLVRVLEGSKKRSRRLIKQSNPFFRVSKKLREYRAHRKCGQETPE